MARKSKPDIYRGRDPREIPTYGIWESAHLLKIPPDTLRSWIRGRKYETERYGIRKFQPLITLPDEKVRTAEKLATARSTHKSRFSQLLS